MKKLLMTAAAAAILATAGAGSALADPPRFDRGGHHDTMRDHGDWDNHGHDRYWRQEYRDRHYVDRGVVFRSLRAHQFYRWAGDPYWFQGRYVVRTYDRFGHLVFVEVDPYTGAFLGVVRF